MFHRNMFSEVDFMLDDLFAQRALIILRLSVHSVLMDFQSAFSGIRGPTDGAEVAAGGDCTRIANANLER